MLRGSHLLNFLNVNQIVCYITQVICLCHYYCLNTETDSLSSVSNDINQKHLIKKFVQTQLNSYVNNHFPIRSSCKLSIWKQLNFSFCARFPQHFPPLKYQLTKIKLKLKHIYVENRVTFERTTQKNNRKTKLLRLTTFHFKISFRLFLFSLDFALFDWDFSMVFLCAMERAFKERKKFKRKSFFFIES